MPEVGEREVKKLPSGLSYAHIWMACPNCGKTRWVEQSAKEINRWCHSCANGKKECRGEKAPNWKGGRTTVQGYVKIWCPKHPYANMRGYVPEHRLVMEATIGRFLLSSEIVHHINGIRDDNRKENLKLVSPLNHRIYTELCGKCPLRTELRLLRWQIKELRESLSFKLKLDD